MRSGIVTIARLNTLFFNSFQDSQKLMPGAVSRCFEGAFSPSEGSFSLSVAILPIGEPSFLLVITD